MLHNPGSR